MSATAVREKRQVTLPHDVFEAAGLKIDDQVDWRFEAGEIRGRKLVQEPEPKRVTAKLVRRGKHLVFEAKGVRVDPAAIGRAVQEERESR
jgi:hypothetical protein